MGRKARGALLSASRWREPLASKGLAVRLEQEYQAITQALRRIEAGLADERGRREILERDLAELKQRLAALQTRIEDIEQRLGR